ncbi:MAG TPA: hypothetical protein VNS02_08735 [Rhizobiaceae bacterium]|nr:hypothetical protein [Rhizobiaceae bacterium]
MAGFGRLRREAALAENQESTLAFWNDLWDFLRHRASASETTFSRERKFE